MEVEGRGMMERPRGEKRFSGGNFSKFRSKDKKVVLFKRRGKKEKVEKEDDEIKRLQSSYDQIDPAKVKNFSDFPLSKHTLQGLTESGYVEPTEIQREVIGLALKGLDILGASKTGSGKTLAFIIPILEILFVRKWNRWDSLGALVITPTRELAQQIYEVLEKVGHYHDFIARLVIGGKDLIEEREVLGQYQILVCTPGRLLQHMEENPHINGDTLQVLVLDEADRCLDPTFAPAINGIIENLPYERRMLLFSATQTKSVRDLVRLGLKDPVYVSVHEHAKYSTPETLQQSYVVCELKHKIDLLWSFIKKHLKKKILVFLSSCKQVSYVFATFCKMQPGVSLLRLHGNLHQQLRMEIYEEFCRKKHVVLFATDIAARGLDFPHVNWVVQMDCPEDIETYIHRVGRTARLQHGGEALLVLLPSEEESMMEKFQERRIPIEKIEVNPAKCVSIQRKLEALLAKYVELKESAQRALVAYVKYVFLMKDKCVFDADQLDIDGFARSLGLIATPRVRFLKKQKSIMEKKERMKNMPHQQEKDEKSFSFPVNDSSDEDEVLTVRRINHDLDDRFNEIPQEIESKKQKKKRERIVTKEQMVKKLMNKKIIPNKKITFDEGGEALTDASRNQTSQAAQDYEAEEGEGGINIARAKEVLREEDELDKKLYKEKLKAQRKMKKDKYKRVQEESEESDEPDLDLSWLPDPEMEGNRPAKRKAPELENKRKKKPKQESSVAASTGLSLLDDEELAVNLLKRKQW